MGQVGKRVDEVDVVRGVAEGVLMVVVQLWAVATAGWCDDVMIYSAMTLCSYSWMKLCSCGVAWPACSLSQSVRPST
jgi:hypothetical protein